MTSPNALNSIYLLIRALLLSSFLASISIAIGLYSYRIYKYNPNSIVDVMDVIFKQSLPPIKIIQTTALSGVIFALIFYGEYIISQIRRIGERPSGFIKFLTGVFLIVCVDIQLFKIDFYVWVDKNIYPAKLSEVLVSQIISIFFIMIFLSIFSRLLNTETLSLPSWAIAERTKRILNSLRYYFVSLLMIMLITYLSAVGFKDKLHYHYLGFDLPVVRSGIFLVSLCFAALFARPPKSLQLPRSLSFVRFLLGVLCFLGVGFFYRQTLNSESFLVYILVASVLSWLSQSVIALVCE